MGRVPLRREHQQHVCSLHISINMRMHICIRIRIRMSIRIRICIKIHIRIPNSYSYIFAP